METDSPVGGEHVFISYHQSDPKAREVTDRITRTLASIDIAFWRDVDGISLGDAITPAVTRELRASHTVLAIVTAEYSERPWCIAELTEAKRLGIRIIPVFVDGAEQLPLPHNDLQGFHLQSDREQDWRELLQKLAPLAPGGPCLVENEQRYLAQLIATYCSTEDVYTELPAEQRVHRSLAKLGTAPLMQSNLHLFRTFGSKPEQAAAGECAEQFDDVLTVLEASPKFVLLGEPGAGKTFALWRATAELARRAQQQADQPLPLFVPLKQWIVEDQPLDEYIDTHCCDPAVLNWRTLAQQRRLALLFDGLNELPTKQRADKAEQIRQLIRDSRPPVLLASCRKQDFISELELDLDRLEVQPLDPPRIRDFTRRYLRAEHSIDPKAGEQQGEALFWHLAGGERIREAWRDWQQHDGRFTDFWSVEDSEKQLPELHKKLGFAAQHFRQAARDNPRSLLKLAANPFLLTMLVHVYLQYGATELPSDENELFGKSVEVLLGRENQQYREREKQDHPGLKDIREALGKLAWELQYRAGGPDEVQLALPTDELGDLLNKHQQALARSANLLEIDDTARFTHQLLQEYFTAQGMKARIDGGKLDAADLWPREQRWQRNGWEQSTLLLAGHYQADPENFFDWLARAHPHLLVQCWKKHELRSPDTQRLAELQQYWLSQLSPDKEPLPEGRHGAGVALGYFGLDERPGIGLRADGLPEIHWQEIPAGEFVYGEGDRQRSENLPCYHLSRYPITNAQYQSFIDAGGYDEANWWEGLAQRIESPDASFWPEPNRPRTDVSWYEAVAFCRWLSDQLGYEVRLPTEQEWEKGARGTDGREYPWGNGYREGYANINERDQGSHFLRETTAVGLYPQSKSPYGLQDMSGNVREWCQNEYKKPEQVQPGGEAARVVRGGSWFGVPGGARSAFRLRDLPDDRLRFIGFRVWCSSPIASDH